LFTHWFCTLFSLFNFSLLLKVSQLLGFIMPGVAKTILSLRLIISSTLASIGALMSCNIMNICIKFVVLFIVFWFIYI